MKFKLLILIVISLLIILNGCREKINVNSSKKLDKLQQECLMVGGTWNHFSNGCFDLCENIIKELPIPCTLIGGYSCDCGPNKCWNESKCILNDEYSLKNHPKLTQSIRNSGFSERSINDDDTISLLIFFNDNVSKDQIKKLSNKYGEFIEQEPAGSGYIVKVREDSILDFINNKEVRWVEEVGPPPTTH